MLQPTKIEQTKPSDPPQQVLFDLGLLEAKATLEQKPAQTLASDANYSTAILTSPALELDLSYFESKLDQQPSSTKPQPSNIIKSMSSEDFMSSTASNSKQQANSSSSKVFLDKLLKDIYVNSNSKSDAFSTVSNNNNNNNNDDKKCKLINFN